MRISIIGFIRKFLEQSKETVSNEYGKALEYGYHPRKSSSLHFTR
jgi:hypothetical protein